MIDVLHTFRPESVALTLGPIAIHWYGLMMLLAIVSALGIAIKLGQKKGILSSVVVDVAFTAVLWGLVGARVYAVLLELPFYLTHPFEIIAVWHGGLAIHGALIGGGAAVWWQVRRRTEGVFLWTDVIAPGVALGQAIGRWGNYFNQELFGRPTSLPWGIPIALQNRPAAYMSAQYFQPTFLYESVLNLINFGLLLGVFYLPLRATKKPASAGWVTGVYLMMYGAIRIVMEQFRADDPPALWGVRWPVIASGGLIVAGGALLLWCWLTRRRRSTYNESTIV